MPSALTFSSAAFGNLAATAFFSGSRELGEARAAIDPSITMFIRTFFPKISAASAAGIAKIRPSAGTPDRLTSRFSARTTPVGLTIFRLLSRPSWYMVTSASSFVTSG
jgi:hypothetical protein